MRNISAASLDKISEQYAIESILIVRIFWADGKFTDYGDKERTDAGVLPKIQTMSGIDDVIAAGGSTSSAQVSVTLDDSDGSLKSIINNYNIHKLRAQVIQWFEGIPAVDSFVIFDGQINSPIIWKEGDRTLSFDIISIIENKEFGFSLEEGDFEFVPDKIAGKPWPVVFGTVPQVPSLQINDSPSAIIAQGFARVYDSEYDFEISELSARRDEAHNNMLSLYNQAFFKSVEASKYRDGDGAFADPDYPDDEQAYAQAFAESIELYRQSNEYALEKINIEQEIARIEEDREERKKYQFNQVFVVSPDIPRGQTFIGEINGSRFLVRVDGVVMNIIRELDLDDRPYSTQFVSLQNRPVAKVYESRKSREKFKWFNAGERIKLINYPIKYVAALGLSQVLGVYSKYQGVTVKLPPTLYTITHEPFTNEEGDTLWAAIITTPTPLTSLKDYQGNQIYESDSIWCDIQGEVNGTFVDIVSWTVQNFTNLLADAPSWDHVKAITLSIPMNFAVLERRNALEFIKDLAFQVKCAAWINGNLLYLRYLPEKPNYVDTITQADILEDTLEVTCSETEEVITKFITTWKFLIRQDEPNLTIHRFNVEQYGIREEQHNYFAFNHIETVKWSARYWCVKKATVWKKIRFKTALNKLKIENFDPILIDLGGGLVSNHPVTGIVETATYESAQGEIYFTVWLPIRFGEMDEYIWGYPKDQTIYFPPDPEIRTGSPWSGVKDTNNVFLATQNTFMGVSLGTRKFGFDGVDLDEYEEPEQPTISTAVTDVPLVFQEQPANMAQANDSDVYEIKPISTAEEATTGTGGTIATVVEHLGGKRYRVQFLNTTRIVECEQVVIADGQIIPNDYPVYPVKIGTKYYMQAPVWIPEIEEE